jgi:hypothetical protein
MGEFRDFTVGRRKGHHFIRLRPLVLLIRVDRARGRGILISSVGVDV